MKIALFDRDYNAAEGSAWFRALQRHGLIAKADAKGTREPPSDLTDPDEISFCHQGAISPWVTAVLSNAIAGHLVILRRRGGTIEIEPPSDRIHSCFWKPEDFETCAIPEVKFFLQSLDEDKPKWQFLQPTSVPEEVLECALLISFKHVAEVPEGIRGAAIESFNAVRKTVKLLHMSSEGGATYGSCDWSCLESDLPGSASNHELLRAFRALIYVLRHNV